MTARVLLFALLAALSARLRAASSPTDSPTNTPTNTPSPSFTETPSCLLLGPVTVTASSGPTAGGNMVTITGGTFSASTIAMFDGVTLTSIIVAPPSVLYGFVPPHAAAVVDVTLYDGGCSANYVGAYTYLGPSPTATASATFSPSATPSPSETGSPVPPPPITPSPTFTATQTATLWPTPANPACGQWLKVPSRNVNPQSIPIDAADDEGGNIALRVYSSHGRFIRDIFTGALQACQSVSLSWDGQDQRGHPVGSGVYILLMRRGEEVVTRRRFVIVH